MASHTPEVPDAHLMLKCCPTCGSTLVDVHCKRRCLKCGYMDDCGSLY